MLMPTYPIAPLANVGSVHCNEGTVWFFNTGFGSAPNESSIGIGIDANRCDANLIFRPCWDKLTAGSPNWGGFGGANCGAASQTFTATANASSYQAPNDTCLAHLPSTFGNVKYTVNCTSNWLQCDQNYFADGTNTTAGSTATVSLGTNRTSLVPTSPATVSSPLNQTQSGTSHRSADAVVDHRMPLAIKLLIMATTVSVATLIGMVIYCERIRKRSLTRVTQSHANTSMEPKTTKAIEQNLSQPSAISL